MEVPNGFFAIVKRDSLGQNFIAIHSGCKKTALPETSLFFFVSRVAQKMLVSYKRGVMMMKILLRASRARPMAWREPINRQKYYR